MLVILLILFGICVPYYFFRQNIISKSYFQCLLFFVVIHYILAFNIHIAKDMIAFNAYAKMGLPISNFHINNAYNISIIYGWFYKIQNNVMVGNILSIIGYIYAMIFLSKLMELLSLCSVRQVWVLILVSITPTSLYYDSVIMREPWMLCFLVMFVYFLFKHYITLKNKYILYSLASFFLLLCLHYKSAIFYGFIFSISYIFFLCNKKYQTDIITKIIFFSILILFIALGLAFFSTKFGGNLDGLYNFLTKKVEFVINYQHIKKTNTNYTLNTNIYEPPIIVFIFQYFRYWFAPYLWQAFSYGFVSFIFASMSLVRLGMLVAIAFPLLRQISNRSKNINRDFLILLLILLIFSSFVYSLGTANYGTSNRHWEQSWWILCLLFVYTRQKIVKIKL